MRLKQGGTYFKGRGIIPMKFQNFVIELTQPQARAPHGIILKVIFYFD